VYERWNILVVADGGAVIEARHGRRRGADGCRGVVDDPSSELTITLSIFCLIGKPGITDLEFHCKIGHHSWTPTFFLNCV
jgi:hypothetical protein